MCFPPLLEVMEVLSWLGSKANGAASVLVNTFSMRLCDFGILLVENL